jgi:hypothetical protein
MRNIKVPLMGKLLPVWGYLAKVWLTGLVWRVQKILQGEVELVVSIRIPSGTQRGTVQEEQGQVRGARVGMFC